MTTNTLTCLHTYAIKSTQQPYIAGILFTLHINKGPADNFIVKGENEQLAQVELDLRKPTKDSRGTQVIVTGSVSERMVTSTQQGLSCRREHPEKKFSIVNLQPGTERTKGMSIELLLLPFAGTCFTKAK